MMRALRATDESFQDLFDRAPFGYLTLNLEDEITRANGTFLALGGYREDEVIGRPFFEMLDRGSRLFYETRHVLVLRLEGEVREVALGLRRADGSTVPVVANSVIVPGSDGEAREVRTAILDATSRSQYERELLAERRAAEAASRRVQVLQRATAAFASSTTEAELASAICEIVGEALDASATAMAIVEGDAMRVIGGLNPLEGLMPPAPPSHGPSMEAMRSERPVVIRTPDDAEREYPHVAVGLRAARLEGLVAFPLLRDGHPLGVLVSFFGRRREIDDDTADLIIAIGRQATQVLVRIRLQVELARLALHDPLTGLPNRALLRETIGRALATAARARKPVAVMFVDLDGFKPINDRFGHNTGDDVLREVADRLRTVVRGNDLVGRVGGDEFVVVCENTDRDVASTVAERVRVATAAPYANLPEGVRVGASIGVAVYHAQPHLPMSTDGILDIADATMYEAKNAGGDRISYRDC